MRDEEVKILAGQVRNQLDSKKSWVKLGADDGGREVGAKLQTRIKGCYAELPSLNEPDSVAHGHLQLALQCGIRFEPDTSFEARQDLLVKKLAQCDSPVVLALPASWNYGSYSTDEGAELRVRGQSFLEALLENEDIQLVVFSRHLPNINQTFLKAIELESVPDASEQWKSGMGDLVAELQKEIGRRPMEFTDATVIDLAKELVHLVQDRPDWKDALLTMQLSRTPVGKEEVLHGVRGRAWGLLFKHLGRGRREFLASESLRCALEECLQPHVDKTDLMRVHKKLGDHHKSLDGAFSPRLVSAEKAIHWLEKVHHFGHAGEEGFAEWERQEDLFPELLWDRARFLSKELRQWKEAAELYERCIRIDPTDAYAWHYLGYNLDMGGLDATRAEVAYRKAIQLRPKSAWNHSRFVRFLISRGRFADAEKAWKVARRTLDPYDDKETYYPEFPLHLHRWVIQEWLEMGEVQRAEKLLNKLSTVTREIPDFQDLVVETSAFKEADALGVTVRPVGYDGDGGPYVLSANDRRGTPLSNWYQARVESVDNEQATLILATTTPPKRVFRKSIPLVEWDKLCNLPPEQGWFVEIGEYGDEVQIARLAPAPIRPIRKPYDTFRWLREDRV